jgi:hypothetical protein
MPGLAPSMAEVMSVIGLGEFRRQKGARRQSTNET